MIFTFPLTHIYICTLLLVYLFSFFYLFLIALLLYLTQQYKLHHQSIIFYWNEIQTAKKQRVFKIANPNSQPDPKYNFEVLR